MEDGMAWGCDGGAMRRGEEKKKGEKTYRQNYIQ
jgi:hypothetical protein